MTRPFFRPRICSLVTSGTRAAETRTGPICMVSAVNRIRRSMGRTDWACAIKALGKAPLALVHLEGPAGHVVGRSVAEDIVKGLGLGHILGIATDDNHHLRLVVSGVVFLSQFRQDRWSWVRVCQGGGRLHEESWHIRNGKRHLPRVGGILNSVNLYKFFAMVYMAILTFRPIHRMDPTSL